MVIRTGVRLLIYGSFVLCGVLKFRSPLRLIVNFEYAFDLKTTRRFGQ